MSDDSCDICGGWGFHARCQAKVKDAAVKAIQAQPKRVRNDLRVNSGFIGNPAAAKSPAGI